MTKIIRSELDKEEVKGMVYDFIDDSLGRLDELKLHFENQGVDLEKQYIRREDDVLKIGVDGYKFAIKIVAERER